MTDSLPTFSVSPAGRSLGAASHTGFCIFMLLLGSLFAGCSDSHSGDFVEFADLKQAVAPERIQEISARSTDTSEDAVIEDTGHDVTDTVPKDQVIPPPGDTGANDLIDNTDVTAAADVSLAGSAEPESQTIKLLIPDRKFRKEGNALRTSFDDIDLLKALNMDPVPVDAADYFPDWLKKLNGAHVRIRGYMRPGFEAEDITEFLFVRDNGECCYGPLPKIYDMIAVQLAEGESTDLIEGIPFDVEGTMRIDPHADDVELYGLFFIDSGVIIE